MITNTVSLELAKELWELGLKIETEKWWADTITDRRRGNDTFDKLHNWKLIDLSCAKSRISNNDKFVFRAYSTDELLTVLPTKISLCAYYTKTEYRVVDNDKERCANTQVNSNPAEALGLMCKHLLTNDYEFNGKEIVRKGEKWTII